MGVDPDATFTSELQRLQPSDVLVLLTDGLTEALDYDDRAYGGRRLHASIRRHVAAPVHILAKQLLWDVRRFAGLATQFDDITLVVVRLT